MFRIVFLFFFYPGSRSQKRIGSRILDTYIGPFVIFCTHVIVWISKAWDKLLEVLHDPILELLHLLLHLSAQVPPLLGVFLHTTEPVVVKDLDYVEKSYICYVRALSRLF